MPQPGLCLCTEGQVVFFVLFLSFPMTSFDFFVNILTNENVGRVFFIKYFILLWISLRQTRTPLLLSPQ